MVNRPSNTTPKMAPASLARTMAEQIADTIAKDIAHGRLMAGEKISEVELAKRFGVSRGPVRDALDLLERNMLVTIKPRSYTIVNKLTVRELEQIYTYRQHILGLAAQFAARNRDDVDLVMLAEGLVKIQTTLLEDTGSLASFSLPAAQMWDLVISASHSHVVNQASMHFTGSNIWSIAVQDKISEASLPAYREDRAKLWDSLYKAIKKGNETTAYKAGAALVKNNWQFLETVFRDYFPE